MTEFHTLILGLLILLHPTQAIAKFKADNKYPGDPSFNSSYEDTAAVLNCPYFKPSSPYSRSSLQWGRFLDKPFPDDSIVLLILQDGNELSVINNRYSLQNGTNLVIETPRTSDRGRYYCKWIYRLRNHYDFKRFTMVLQYVDADHMTSQSTTQQHDVTMDREKVTSKAVEEDPLNFTYLAVQTCDNTTVLFIVILIAIVVYYVMNRRRISFAVTLNLTREP
ncbi:uncharacterized protein [Ptychodera flava]|uniref:uncharacterized protein n=1 Tax=Ptychodera flava TaxID=63121 RepID=UPI00396A69F9